MLQEQTGAALGPGAADAVFRALADPTRRGVIERLNARRASVSELAAPYDMALPSFMEHLKCWRLAGWCSRARKAACGPIRSHPTA